LPLLLLLLEFLITDLISVLRIPSIADLELTSLITKGENPEIETLKTSGHTVNIIYVAKNTPLHGSV
jgi:hypothetical protein